MDTSKAKGEIQKRNETGKIKETENEDSMWERPRKTIGTSPIQRCD